MQFLIHILLAFVSLFLIVLACVLFTNAIEFLGNKLKLGSNAVGSVLAVFGTGLPETIVPLVALLSIYFSDIKIETAQDIALGAILGSPFMLGTLALFILGLVLLTKKRDKKVLYVDFNNVLRDLKYFLIAYGVAILFSIGVFREFKFVAPVILISLYIFFVYRTIVKSRVTCVECECERLYFLRIFKTRENVVLFLQLTLSLLMLAFFSHIFVGEIKYFSILLNISPAVLALLIAPFATELPECINSIIWLKQDKDDLAIANIVGAMAFQAMIPFSIGIGLTSWVFDKYILANIFLVVFCTIVFTIALKLKRKITSLMLLSCGIFYLLFIIYILR